MYHLISSNSSSDMEYSSWNTPAKSNFNSFYGTVDCIYNKEGLWERGERGSVGHGPEDPPWSPASRYCRISSMRKPVTEGFISAAIGFFMVGWYHSHLHVGHIFLWGPHVSDYGTTYHRKTMVAVWDPVTEYCLRLLSRLRGVARLREPQTLKGHVEW